MGLEKGKNEKQFINKAILLKGTTENEIQTEIIKASANSIIKITRKFIA